MSLTADFDLRPDDDAAAIEAGTRDVCCRCLAIVPWLYLDVCEGCLPDTWTATDRAAYRAEWNLTRYSPRRSWRKAHPR
jgi:hypothetical protein